jgi:hypothetical protein
MQLVPLHSGDGMRLFVDEAALKELGLIDKKRPEKIDDKNKKGGGEKKSRDTRVVSVAEVAARSQSDFVDVGRVLAICMAPGKPNFVMLRTPGKNYILPGTDFRVDEVGLYKSLLHLVSCISWLL